MRIAIDIRHLAQKHHTGIGQYTIELIHALAKEYPKNEYILFSSGTSKGQKYIPSFSYPNISYFHAKIPNRILTIKILLFKSFKLENLLPNKPDVWLLPNINFFRTKLPYSVTIHDLSFIFFPHFFTLKQKLWHHFIYKTSIVQKANVIFAVSKLTKQDILRTWNIKENRIKVTHLGIDFVDTVRPKPTDKTTLRSYGIKSPYFLTFSSREPRKNLIRVIHAFTEYKKRNQKNKDVLVLAGGLSWKEKDIQKAISNSDYSKEILLAGYIEEKDKPALYRHAISLLFPSIYEGFGLPPLEAAFFNTPVISSSYGASPEIIKNASIYINPFHTHEIVSAMEAIKSNSVHKYYQQQGKDNTLKYSWKNTAKATQSGLNSIFKK